MKRRTAHQLPVATVPLTSGTKRGTERRIVVEHQVHGRHEAEGVKDRLQAVQSAAKAWGGLQWSTIARECTFTEVKANDAVDSGG